MTGLLKVRRDLALYLAGAVSLRFFPGLPGPRPSLESWEPRGRGERVSECRRQEGDRQTVEREGKRRRCVSAGNATLLGIQDMYHMDHVTWNEIDKDIMWTRNFPHFSGFRMSDVRPRGCIPNGPMKEDEDAGLVQDMLGFGLFVIGNKMSW